MLIHDLKGMLTQKHILLGKIMIILQWASGYNHDDRQLSPDSHELFMIAGFLLMEMFLNLSLLTEPVAYAVLVSCLSLIHRKYPFNFIFFFYHMFHTSYNLCPRFHHLRRIIKLSVNFQAMKMSVHLHHHWV